MLYLSAAASVFFFGVLDALDWLTLLRLSEDKLDVSELSSAFDMSVLKLPDWFDWVLSFIYWVDKTKFNLFNFKVHIWRIYIYAFMIMSMIIII